MQMRRALWPWSEQDIAAAEHFHGREPSRCGLGSISDFWQRALSASVPSFAIAIGSGGAVAWLRFRIFGQGTKRAIEFLRHLCSPSSRFAFQPFRTRNEETPPAVSFPSTAAGQRKRGARQATVRNQPN
jgi:hypothetical protein